MRARRALFAALFVGGVSGASSVAHAQPKPVERCTGNFEEAQLKERRGKLVDAEQLYAACADPKCPSMIRADCSAKHDDVARRVPTITVVVRDPSGKDLDSAIDIDGQPVADRLRLRPIDPGEHVVHYRVQGQPPAAQTIAIVEGEKARVIAITAKGPPTAAKPEGASAQNDVPSQASTIGPIVLGAGGILLIGVAVYLHLNASSDRDKSDTYRAKAEDPNVSASDRQAYADASKTQNDAAKNSELGAIIAGAAGLVAIGGAVTWYLVTRPQQKGAAFAPLPVSPAVSPSYAGATFDVRF